MATPDFSTMTDEQLDAYIAQQQQALQGLQKLVDQSTTAEKTDERGLIASGKAWFEGADKDPSIPVLGEDVGTDSLGFSGEKGNLLITAITTSFDDQSLMQAIKKIDPATKFQQDEFGNLVAGAAIRDEQGEIVKYEKFYPNPKGLDAPTITQITGIAALAPAIQKATGAVGLPTTGYKGAAVTGMAEAGLLEAMGAQAAGREFRLSEIPSGALGGVLGKGVIDVGGMVFNIAKAFKDSPQAFIERTPEVEKAIIDSGFDPAVVMPQVRSEIERMVREGLDPIESARVTAAQSLPYPVPLTSGQVSGLPAQQLFEEQAATRVFGEQAEALMQNRFRKQQEAIAENIPAIQAKMAGDVDAPIQRGEGMAAAQAELVAQKGAAEKAYKDAYKGAGGTGSFVIPENAPMAESVIRDRLGQFRRTSSPSAFALADELTEMFQDGRSLKEMFEFRKSITALSAAGGTEAGAAGALKRAFDDILMEQAEKGLLYGNPTDVAAGLDAISKFAEFKRVWETKGVLTTLTAKELRDGSVVLKVAPEDAANAILGKTIAQSTSKFNLTRDLLTLKKQLPEEQWNQVRQEVFINLADTMQRTGKVGQEASLMFNKAWRNLKDKNPSMVKALFNKDEVALIDNLAGTSALVAGAAKNTSNSALSAMGAMQRLSASFGVAGGFQRLASVKGMDILVNTMANIRMPSTLRGGLTPTSRAAETFGTFAGVGGTMGIESPILSPIQQAIQEQQSREQLCHKVK